MKILSFWDTYLKKQDYYALFFNGDMVYYNFTTNEVYRHYKDGSPISAFRKEADLLKVCAKAALSEEQFNQLYSMLKSFVTVDKYTVVSSFKQVVKSKHYTFGDFYIYLKRELIADCQRLGEPNSWFKYSQNNYFE